MVVLASRGEGELLESVVRRRRMPETTWLTGYVK